MKVLCVHDAQQVTAWWEEEADCCCWQLYKGRCVSIWEGDIEKLQKGKSYGLEGIWQCEPLVVAYPATLRTCALRLVLCAV